MLAQPRRLAAALALAATLAASHSAAAQDPDPWPRELRGRGATLVVHQPQVEAWTGNRVDLRAAVTVRPAAGGEEGVGVVWATARTHVDRGARLVALEDVQVTRANFPLAPDRGTAFLATLRERFDRSRQTIALDRLEASLAAARADPPTGIAVRNDPPAIVVSERPAVLVQVDGDPAFQPVQDTGFARLINTRNLILRPIAMGSEPGYLYLRIGGGWMMAEDLAGPWRRPADPPAALEALAAAFARGGRLDLLDGAGTAFDLYVTTNPAELIVFRGPARFDPIAGTGLAWASNTTADVIRDAGGNVYALLSGRWYRAAALAGSWSYVASAALPPDFQRIPPDSPAGVVLAAVAGTRQAREAAIAATVPQTATVPRVDGPAYAPVLDGPPQLRAVEGTTLQSVANSPTPILRAADGAFYAVRAGVWFHAAALAGPWYVAPAVPKEIYSIPATSPLHFVTYVRIYDSTASVVRMGYTPGYLGAVVNREGIVVYGTGYPFPSWTGALWFPSPPTWGVAAQPVHNPATGWSYGFAPSGASTGAPADGRFHPADAPSRERCCPTTATNVYAVYGFGTRRTSPQADTARYTPPPSASPLWRGELYASSDGQVHRNTGAGWEVRTAGGWQGAAGDTTALDEERAARDAAQAHASRWSFGGSGSGSSAGGGDRLGGGSGWGDQAGLGGGGWGDRFGNDGDQATFRF